MDKAEILDYVKNREGKLIGYYPVAFPVYVVHVAYDSVDTDPFFPIHRALLKYTELDTTHNQLAYFSRLIGFDLEMLKRCIMELKEDGMIRFHQDHYVITDEARRKFLVQNSRPTVRISGSFIVDGKNLELLPEVVYKNKRNLTVKEQNVSTHLPVDLAMSAAPADKVEKYLDKGSNRDLLHIESAGDNFEVLNFDKKFLVGACAVFYLDKDQNYHKEMIYCGETIQCEALGSALTYSIDMVLNKYDHWVFKPNLGYNVAKAEDMKQVVIFTKNEGWSQIITERYKLKPQTPFMIDFLEVSKLPRLVLTEEMLLSAAEPRILLDDAKQKFIDFNIEGKGIVRIATPHTVQLYLDLMNLINEWIDYGKTDGTAFAALLSDKYPNWRNLMVQFDFLDELEWIDNDCFILNC